MKKKAIVVSLVLGTAALVCAGIAKSAQKSATTATPEECCDPNSPEMCGDATPSPAKATKPAAKPASVTPAAVRKKPAALL